MLTKLFHGRDERCFERFRRTGDPSALAQVFDRTAPELFGLAARLAPAPGLAQDLLQQTFLAAIESAESWDSARRLAPWLVGILVREARLLRRREARVPDGERIGGNAPADPARMAEDREFAAALALALDALPERYRKVLELHLVAGKPAAEIAETLGRTSGTVRVQIHRGLEMLRKALPAGFAAAGAVAVVSPRALADVRARVLAAAPAAKGAAALTLGTGTLVGSLALKKLGLAATVVVIAAGALWLALEPAAREEAVAAGVAAPFESTAAPEVSAADPVSAPAQDGGTRRALESDERPAGDAQSASLSGRLLEEDGTPIADTTVELLELPPSLFELDFTAVFSGVREDPRLVLATTRTDAEGRFGFDGAQERALHALGIDLGGRRGTLRILDQGLARGATTEIGDVVLARSAALTGRVVDGEGRPVSGARVRVTEPFDEELLENDLHRLRATSLVVSVSRRWRDIPAETPLERTQLVGLPRWLMSITERLPVPTAHTDAEGRFALDAPLGRPLVLVVDDPRFAPLVRDALRLSAPMDLGSVVVDAGRALECRVVDASGAPVVGAEVLAGTLGAKGEVVVCEPAEPGADGLHRRSGATGELELFVVRANAGSPWTVAGPFEGRGTKTVVLKDACTLLLDVSDGAGGPVEGVELSLTVADAVARTDELEFLGAWTPVGGAPERTGPTTYAIPGLAQGVYLLSARAPGRTMVRNQVVVAPVDGPMGVVLRAASAVEVRVVDDASGEPSAGAEVAVRKGRQGRYAIIERELTDERGRAVVEWGAKTGGDGTWQVRATHEGHAVAGTTLAAGTSSVELRLARPARLLAHVHRGGKAPDASTMLSLQPVDETLRNSANLPWHALTDAEGRCTIGELPPGTYRYDVGERFLAGDPTALLLSGSIGAYFDFDKGILEKRLSRGTVELRAGEELRLDIDLGAQLREGAATLSGRMTRNGRGMKGIELELDVEGAELVRTTDASGAFDFGVVAAGKAFLKGEDHELGSTILRLEFPLAAGERRVLDLAFDPMTVDVRLVDAGGQPLADADLELQAHSRLYDGAHVHVRTGGDGRARVTLPGCGLYAWEAETGGARAEGEVYVLSTDELTLAFHPRSAFPVRFTLPPELACTPKSLLLMLHPGVESAEMRNIMQLDPSTWTFDFEGPPGRYRLTVGCDERRCRPIEFEAPPPGLTEQHLAFELTE